MLWWRRSGPNRRSSGRCGRWSARWAMRWCSRRRPPPRSRWGRTTRWRWRRCRREGADMPATILIVDDEKNIRRTVRMVLEGEGFSVEEASSGEEALARLPDIGADVMLLDVQLPGISGLETLE